MIVITKKFNLNGETLEKGKKLQVKKGFSQKGDISEATAKALKARGVAEDFKDEPTTKPKPTDNKQSKKQS